MTTLKRSSGEKTVVLDELLAVIYEMVHHHL